MMYPTYKCLNFACVADLTAHEKTEHNQEREWSMQDAATLPLVYYNQ